MIGEKEGVIALTRLDEISRGEMPSRPETDGRLAVEETGDHFRCGHAQRVQFDDFIGQSFQIADFFM